MSSIIDQCYETTIMIAWWYSVLWHVCVIRFWWDLHENVHE